jgi:hypothetical protein
MALFQELFVRLEKRFRSPAVDHGFASTRRLRAPINQHQLGGSISSNYFGGYF